MKKLRDSIIVVMLALLGIVVPAFAISPEQMPNVQVANRGEYVSDPAGLLPDDVKDRVNRRLADLRSRTSVEAVVAIPPEIGDEEPQVWSEKLFSLWKIGKKDRDNGVMLMISPGSRAAFIMTGYGVEGVLTDIACKNIINRAVIPAMREDDLGAAVDQATQMMDNALSDPAVAEELKSSEPDNFSGAMDTIDVKYFIDFIKYVAAAMFLMALVLFVRDCINSRRRESNHSKAELWRAHLTVYIWLGILSCGAGLIFFLLDLWLYRSWRTRRLKCPTCGAKMNRLPEEQDNELLSDSQDLEENLNTVDYDVWECPDCGTIERFPYKVKQNKYTECPNCHTVAMCLDSDTVVRPSTVRSEGEGVKVYECKFCHHRHEKRYKIARKEDTAAVLGAVAGSAIGSRRGGGGFGGGGFGGGFGGGMTGGGGAGGRW